MKKISNLLKPKIYYLHHFQKIQLSFLGISRVCFSCAPKVGDFKTKGDFLAAKAERKALQDKPSTKMKNLAKRFTTIAKNDPDNKEVNSANTKATAIESLADHIDKAIKLLQSDRPFPDTFEHDTACATLIAYKKKYIK